MKNSKFIVYNCLVFILIFTALFSNSVFADGILVESIKISVNTTQMLVGDTQKIKFSYSPANADNPVLVYTSSDNSIVTAGVGVLIANKAGKADITVSVKDTNISDKVTIEVVDKPPTVLVDKIELSAESISLERYAQKYISYNIYPSNATDKTIIFSSENENVATVDNNGSVYGRNIGQTRIVAKSQDGNTTSYLYVNVYSSSSPGIDFSNTISVDKVEIWGKTKDETEDIKITDTVEIMATQSKNLFAKVFPANATDTAVRWRSDDTDIATVDDTGKITAVKEGDTQIYAISNSNGRSCSVKINVIPYVRYPDSIKLEVIGTPKFVTGETFKMKVTFFPEDTTERKLNWLVKGNNAIVDNNGNVTITDNGKVSIQVWTADFKKSAEYEFEATYSENHFALYKEAFNIKPNRRIFIEFDSKINIESAVNGNIFASADSTGNSKIDKCKVYPEGKKIIVENPAGWDIGENYIFIKSGVCDIYGNKLGKNLKYKFNVRSVVK